MAYANFKKKKKNGGVIFVPASRAAVKLRGTGNQWYQMDEKNLISTRSSFYSRGPFRGLERKYN
jgi:hypothetical protein